MNDERVKCGSILARFERLGGDSLVAHLDSNRLAVRHLEIRRIESVPDAAGDVFFALVDREPLLRDGEDADDAEVGFGGVGRGVGGLGGGVRNQ